jgi:hypothetical protein
MTKVVPPEVLARAKKLFAVSGKWHTVAAEVGFSAEVLMRRLVPGYADRRDAGVRRNRADRRANPRGVNSKHRAESRPDPQDAARALASVPPDTRTPDARLFGDPLPGRSALTRRPSR